MKFFEKYNLQLFIIIVCISLLEACFIIYCNFTKEWSTISWQTETIFSCVTAVICSILATAITLFFPNANNNVTLEDMNKIVEEPLKRLPEDINKIMEETLKELPNGKFPILYEDTNDPNVNFNNRLNKAIESTKRFIYFGDRGLYLTKRLGRQIVHHDSRLEIYVFLADIREDSIFESRERMYLKKEKANLENGEDPRSPKEIIINEKMKVLRTLYALGKLSQKYEIHIYLHKEIPFMRFELTDSLMALTFLTQWTSGKKYPATLIFENNDLFSINFADYSEQIKKRSVYLTTDDLTVDNLRNLAKDAGLPDFKDEEITEYYETNVR